MSTDEKPIHSAQLSKEVQENIELLPALLTTTELSLLITLLDFRRPATTSELRKGPMTRSDIRLILNELVAHNFVEKKSVKINDQPVTVYSARKKPPVTEAEVKQAIPSYESTDSALKSLEKEGIVLRRTSSSKEANYKIDLWYLNPAFLKRWTEKRKEILKEFIEHPEITKRAYERKTLLLFDIS